MKNAVEITQIDSDIKRLEKEIEKLNAAIESRKVRQNQLKLQAMERSKRQADPKVAKKIVAAALVELEEIQVHIDKDIRLINAKSAELNKLVERREKGVSGKMDLLGLFRK